MDVVLVGEVLVLVAHVVAGVDVEILTLGVGDLGDISLDARVVLSQESADNGVVVGGRLGHHGRLVGKSESDHGQESPAEGHLSEVADLRDGLKGEPHTEGPADSVVAGVGVVEVGELSSVGEGQVVRDQEALMAVVVEEGVEPVKTVVLDEKVAEPGTSGCGSDATGSGLDAVQHVY